MTVDSEPSTGPLQPAQPARRDQDEGRPGPAIGLGPGDGREPVAAEVAVLGPAPGPYTYELPPALRMRAVPGARVLVPLGGQRQVEGVVLRSLSGAELARGADAGRALRPVARVIEGPGVPPDLVGLAGFIAEYYLAPMGEALRLVLPSYEQARVAEQAALTEAGRMLATELAGALLSPEAAARAAALSPLEQHVLRGLHARELKVRRKGAVSLETLTKDVAAGLPAALRAKPADVTAALRSLAASGHTELRERVAAGVQARGALSGARVVLDAPAPAPAPVLTSEQQHALDALLAGLEGSLAAEHTSAPQSSGYRGFLLHGVTGSGKTELYLRLIDAALQKGRTALVLVPEIALTPQLLQRFAARFGDDIAVLHSALSTGQRAEAWRRLLAGQVRIALGPRSALFAPLARLGVVIVDEEHDGSFKQQDGVRYHGRDVALFRAQRAGAVAVLGSATPSLESLDLARRGKLTRLTLTQRATGMPLPQVQVVDLKQHVLPRVKAAPAPAPAGDAAGESARDDRVLLSSPLEQALAETLAAGEQAILFLNRRGYSTFLLCKSCGHRLECPHCAVTLTWHKGDDVLSCHYCGHTEPVATTCPLCNAPSVQRLGVGTEKLAEQIAARFPGARVARLDRDTSGSLTDVLGQMHRREIDIIVGTQMLAKGHDFPGVTLVGVILADTGMGLPDFRASERTFQLLAQVAGRAGRKDRPGRVLIQTFNPEHPAVVYACTHDYASFAEQELAARLPLGYPPAVRLGVLRVDGVDPYEVKRAAEAVGDKLRKLCTRAPAEAQLSILGPAEAPLSRLKGRTRWQILVRAATSKALRVALRTALAMPLPRSLRLSADVDPVSTL